MALKFDQTGLSAGVAGYSRTDGLATGALVTVTRSGSDPGTARLVMTPPDDTGALASWTQTSSTTWTFTPTAGTYGTYRVEEITLPGTTRESRQSRIFGIRLPRSGLLIPALNERADARANMVDTSTAITDASDNNSSDNLRNPDLAGFRYAGWWRSMVELYRVVENSSFIRPIRAVLLENTGTFAAGQLNLPTAEQVDGVSLSVGDYVLCGYGMLASGTWCYVARHAGSSLDANIPENSITAPACAFVTDGRIYGGRTFRNSLYRSGFSSSNMRWFPENAPMRANTKRLTPSGGAASWVNLITASMNVSASAVHNLRVEAIVQYAGATAPRRMTARADYVGDGGTAVILVGDPPSLADPGETDVEARVRVTRTGDSIAVDCLRDPASGGQNCDYRVTVDIETARLS